MQTINEYEVEFPQWALYQLTYGDDGSLSEEECEQIENFCSPYYQEAKECGGQVIFSPTGETNEFCAFPEFGLACATETLKIIICK